MNTGGKREREEKSDEQTDFFLLGADFFLLLFPFLAQKRTISQKSSHVCLSKTFPSITKNNRSLENKNRRKILLDSQQEVSCKMSRITSIDEP